MTTVSAPPPYPSSGDAALAYDVGAWHAGPLCAVSLGYPYLFCGPCHVVAHIDLVGRHIVPSSSAQPRQGGAP